MKVKGKRTFGFAVAIAAAYQIPEVQALIASYPEEAGVAIGGVVAALRFLTTTPLFKSE